MGINSGFKTEQSDVATELVAGRGEVIVSGCETKHGRGIHFCNDELLSGDNHNLWFPLNADDDWFTGIERVLVMNGLAENVVHITPLNDGSGYQDWRVKYNLRVV